MSRRPAFLAALAFVFMWLAAALATPAVAFESASYGMEVLVDGVPLAEYAARGTTYVEALAGLEYSVRLTNRTARRIAVALSVDGLNTIDAKATSPAAAAKWILAPYESVTLDGWQTGAGTARRFFFTTEEESYGAWLGKTRNLGIVSAAVFRERRPEPVAIRPFEGGRLPSSESAGAEKSARSDAAAPGSPRPQHEEDYAATGIGRELDHRVRRVIFEAETSPAAVLELRYEYRDALVRLGVLPQRCPDRDDPLARRERARGFEGFDFAPSPR